MGGLLRLAMIGAALVGLLCAAEWADPEAPARARVRRYPGRTDLGWFLVYLAYAPLAARGAMAAASAVSRRGVLHGNIARWPATARFVAAVIVAEGCAYWWHRASHASPVLWRVHVVHHRPTELHWWSAFRFHPLDGALSHGVPLIAAAVCGFGPAVLSGYLGVALVVTVFAHADVWLPGPVATLVAALVATPGFHRTHHEIGRDHGNFALVLPVFDHVFGTASSSSGVRRFGTDAPDQRRATSPSASDATLATALTARATAGAASWRRPTRAASI